MTKHHVNKAHNIRSHNIRSYATMLVLALGSSGFMGVAHAQQALLQGYQGVVGSLEAAQEAQANKQAAASQDRLSEAINRFRKLAPDIGAKVLVEGIENALRQAQIAVSRSSTDLVAQTGLVRGMLRRALQEELLNQVEARGPLLPKFTNLLSNDYGLDATARKQLLSFANTANVEGVRVVAQRQAALKMLASLKTAASSDTKTAFSNMATASSWFMSVQNAPEMVGDIQVEQFGNALKNLNDGDRGSFDSVRSSLKGDVEVLATALDPSNVTPTQLVANPIVPITKPTVVPPNTLPSSGSVVLGNGDSLYAPLAKALVAVGDANILQARVQLKDAKAIFQKQLGNKLGSKDSDARTRILNLFDKYLDPMGSVGLRVPDIEGLISEVTAADALVSGGEPTMNSGARGSVGTIWVGWLRALLFIAIAGLAFIPLYYLNLAFGGRNRYWRFIGIAMVLLFVPAIVEGVAQLGSLLSELLGVRFFDLLSSLSVLQNPVAQLFWALILLTASILAIIGFRGICIQFGLIRLRGQNLTTTQLDTTNGTSKDTPNPDKKNTFEWDEEF